MIRYDSFLFDNDTNEMIRYESIIYDNDLFFECPITGVHALTPIKIRTNTSSMSGTITSVWVAQHGLAYPPSGTPHQKRLYFIA